MSYSDFHEQLREAGLVVIYEDPEYTRERIRRLINKEPLSFIRYCTVTRVFPNKKRDNTLQITLELNIDAWSISVNEGHGAFHYDDFICLVPHSEEVVRVALRYYFGTATNINKWIVPLHRHPELDEQHIEQAIHHAKMLTPTEYASIRESYREQSQMKEFPSEWERTLERDFMYFFHQTETQFVCAMRRNAQQAYIIPRYGIEDSNLTHMNSEANKKTSTD